MEWEKKKGLILIDQEKTIFVNVKKVNYVLILFVDDTSSLFSGFGLP